MDWTCSYTVGLCPAGTREVFAHEQSTDKSWLRASTKPRRLIKRRMCFPCLENSEYKTIELISLTVSQGKCFNSITSDSVC